MKQGLKKKKKKTKKKMKERDLFYVEMNNRGGG